MLAEKVTLIRSGFSHRSFRSKCLVDCSGCRDLYKSTSRLTRLISFPVTLLRHRMSSLSKADFPLLEDRNVNYQQQLWYALAICLILVGCFQWGSFLHSKASHRHKFDEETASHDHVHYKFSLRRIPLAFVNIYRVVAFRWTLEIGQTYTFNIAEIFVTLGYITLLLTYTFINSKSTCPSYAIFAIKPCSHLYRESEARHHILEQPRGPCCSQSDSPRHGLWYKE